MASDTRGLELSILKGGPLSRAVYFTRDLEAACRADERMGHRPAYVRTDEFTSPLAVYEYVPSETYRELEGRSARVWLFDPDRTLTIRHDGGRILP